MVSSSPHCEPAHPRLTFKPFNPNPYLFLNPDRQKSRPAGSYAMATELAGQLYDRAMRRQRHAAGDCTGPDCFRYTFLTCCALAAVGTVLAALLWRRTGKQYQTIIKVRIHLECDMIGATCKPASAVETVAATALDESGILGAGLASPGSRNCARRQSRLPSLLCADPAVCQPAISTVVGHLLEGLLAITLTGVGPGSVFGSGSWSQGSYWGFCS